MTQNNFQIDFIGVGSPKSGTTWAAHCLKEHPQICLAPNKEISFFNKEYSFFQKNMPWQYQYGIGWYKNHFRHCREGQIKGEFSVHYLHDYDSPRLIRKHFPNTKILMILRNPIDRLYAHYLQGKTASIRFPSFEEVVEKEKKFVEMGFYHQHIQRYLQYFPKEKILILIYEDIEKDPFAFMQKIYKFLGVDENFIPPSLFTRPNPTALKLSFKMRAYRTTKRFLAKNFLNNRLGKKFSLFIKRSKQQKSEKLQTEKSKTEKFSYKKVSGDLRKKLNKIYQPETQKLEKLIGRNLSFWV